MSEPETAEIPLTRGMTAVVDRADLELVSGYAWYAHKARNTWYARTDIGTRKIRHRVYLHRLLAGVEGAEVDHENGNGLDNRRSNLRVASRSLNAANTPGRGGASRFKGVAWDASKGRWVASVMVNKHRLHLGRYDSEDDAARAYDAGALRHFGEFARLNFPAGVKEAV